MARPKFTPTVEQRKQVKALAAYGISQDEIAKYIDVAPKTLRKHFRRELELGIIDAKARIANKLYQIATTGNGNVAALIFLAKTRLGWREQGPSASGPTTPPPLIINMVPGTTNA